MKFTVTAAVALAYLGVVTSMPESPLSTRDEDFHDDDIITRDVCIVGGGSGGTYTATRLQEMGKSVVVIEKESLMGGHTNTYTVPGTDQTIDYGVVVFHNNSLVESYFGHYNIPLAPAAFGSPTVTYNVDFRTGIPVPGYTPSNPATALGLYAQQLLKYPYLATGFNLPDPIPTDLLLSFKDFVTKYSLQGMVQIISELGQGYADLLEQPTLYAFKLLGLDLLQTLKTGYIATAAHDNHLLYDAATAQLTAAKSLLLSSYILHVDRSHHKGIKIVVQTPNGKKLIKAKKIVVAIPPRISNFNGWDLDSQEEAIFSTYRNEAYYTGLITNTGLPLGSSVVNVGSNTPYNLPALPGIYGFSSTASPGLIDVKYASTFEQDSDTVKSNIITALGKLQIPGITTTPKAAQWKAFNAHVPFFEHVSIDQIKGGFYSRANTLQGHRDTWYTGAAWEAHDSSSIWAFTETILVPIAA